MAQLANNNDELILEFFNEEYKPINSLEDFTLMVHKIEKIKNYSSEIFIKLLIYHRIVKGNKQLFYIGMMILKDEDPKMYVKILNLIINEHFSIKVTSWQVRKRYQIDQGSYNKSSKWINPDARNESILIIYWSDQTFYYFNWIV